MQLLQAEEVISGARAIHISLSGNARIAMASVSGRMPASMILHDNALSGDQFVFNPTGVLQFTSGLVNVSGFQGKAVYVGRSGHVTQLSGSWGSGGFLSGDLGQVIGTAISYLSGDMGVIAQNLIPLRYSGGPLALHNLGVGGPLE